MKLDIEKLKEIYGEQIVIDIHENMDSLVENINCLISYGFKDPYDVVETNPYLFLVLPETFQEKMEKLTQKLGVEFVEKLSEDMSLWSEIDD